MSMSNKIMVPRCYLSLFVYIASVSIVTYTFSVFDSKMKVIYFGNQDYDEMY